MAKSYVAFHNDEKDIDNKSKKVVEKGTGIWKFTYIIIFLPYSNWILMSQLHVVKETKVLKEKSLPHWQVTGNLLTCPKFDLRLGSGERQSVKMVFMDKLLVYHRTILSKFTTGPYWASLPQDHIEQVYHRTRLSKFTTAPYWANLPQDHIQQVYHRTILSKFTTGPYWTTYTLRPTYEQAQECYVKLNVASLLYRPVIRNPTEKCASVLKIYNQQPQCTKCCLIPSYRFHLSWTEVKDCCPLLKSYNQKT